MSSVEMCKDICPSEVGFLTGQAGGTLREIAETGGHWMMLSITLVTWKQEAQHLHHFRVLVLKKGAEMIFYLHRDTEQNTGVKL